jgi:regulator of RNase E activity RraA
VIVVEQRTGIEAGCWGGLLTLGAKVRGVAGVIADGPLRDVDEAVAYEFPIFSRSLTALTARGRVVEKGTNVPVNIGEIAVAGGDYVLCDGSGAIFIAAADIERVLQAAETIVAKEAAMARAILGGTAIGQVMAGNYEHMLEN